MRIRAGAETSPGRGHRAGQAVSKSDGTGALHGAVRRTLRNRSGARPITELSSQNVTDPRAADLQEPDPRLSHQG